MQRVANGRSVAVWVSALALCVLGSGSVEGRAQVAGVADSVMTRFEAANAAYEEGRYEEAVAAYRRLLDDGHASGALYHNLGNAYMRREKLGQAIRFYEKARRLRPNDPQIAHSLEQARRRAGVYPDRFPPNGVRAQVRAWPSQGLFIGGLLLLGGGLFLAVAWARPGQPGPWRHPAVWGPIVGGSLLVVGALSGSALQAQDRHAVVIAGQASLHDTPGGEATADTALAEGTLLEIRESRNGWVAVRTADGTFGWVRTQAVGEI